MARVARRHVLIAAGVLLVEPLVGAAQSAGKVPRVGYLALNTLVIGKDVLAAFRQSMLELGWIDGRNIVIDTRFADGNVDRLPALVDELLRLKVDMIVTTSSASTRASQSATK